MRNPFVNEPDCGVQVKVYELGEKTKLSTVAEQAVQRPFMDHIYLPGQIIEFPTKPGHVYLVSKEIPWISNVPLMDV